MSILDGCSDGNCWLRDNAHVMHTNGGCRCVRDARRIAEFRSAFLEMKAKADKVDEMLLQIRAYEKNYDTLKASQAPLERELMAAHRLNDELKKLVRKYAEEADRRSRQGFVSCSHEQMSADAEIAALEKRNCDHQFPERTCYNVGSILICEKCGARNA